MIAYDRRLRTPARALLVLEQLVLANVLERALQQQFYKTRLARTIEDARLALAEWPPHVVILDFEQAGSALLDWLRPARVGGSVPVIALTHNTDLQTKLAAFDRGAGSLLSPVDAGRPGSGYRAPRRCCSRPSQRCAPHADRRRRLENQRRR